MRVAFNGFGEIGQHIFRELYKYPEIEVVGIQVKHKKSITDRIEDLKNNSHYGRWHTPVICGKNGIQIRGNDIPVLLREKFQSRWQELGDIDFLIDCSGNYKNESKGSIRVGSHGVKKTIITGPAEDVDATIIYGVNHSSYAPHLNIISAASCTSTCAATVLDSLSCAFRIKNGFAITVHALTNSQSPHDASLIREHSTSASKIVGKILPHLNGRIQFSAVRVPAPQVSYIHFVLNSEIVVAPEDVRDVLQKASQALPAGVLEITDKPLKNKDTNSLYLGNCHSAIVNKAKIRCNRGMIDFYAWYDNEYGYSCRVVDLLRYMAKRDKELKTEVDRFVPEYIPRPEEHTECD